MSATVVKGFGRGSKLLGIPTANMDMKEVRDKIHDTATGIYFGYTMLKGTVYPAVVSIGWNPYFENEEKTLVTCLYSVCTVQWMCSFKAPPFYGTCFSARATYNIVVSLYFKAFK